MNKKQFEESLPSLKKNVFWEKQKTSERILDRDDYENACLDVSQVAENCIDKQIINEIIDKQIKICEKYRGFDQYNDNTIEGEICGLSELKKKLNISGDFSPSDTHKSEDIIQILKENE